MAFSDGRRENSRHPSSSRSDLGSMCVRMGFHSFRHGHVCSTDTLYRPSASSHAMKLYSPRFTVRWLMVAVGLAGLGLGAEAYRRHLVSASARYHATAEMYRLAAIMQDSSVVLEPVALFVSPYGPPTLSLALWCLPPKQVRFSRALSHKDRLFTIFRPVIQRLGDSLRSYPGGPLFRFPTSDQNDDDPPGRQALICLG